LSTREKSSSGACTHNTSMSTLGQKIQYVAVACVTVRERQKVVLTLSSGLVRMGCRGRAKAWRQVSCERG